MKTIMLRIITALTIALSAFFIGFHTSNKSNETENFNTFNDLYCRDSYIADMCLEALKAENNEEGQKAYDIKCKLLYGALFNIQKLVADKNCPKELQVLAKKGLPRYSDFYAKYPNSDQFLNGEFVTEEQKQTFRSYFEKLSK